MWRPQLSFLPHVRLHAMSALSVPHRTRCDVLPHGQLTVTISGHGGHGPAWHSSAHLCVHDDLDAALDDEEEKDEEDEVLPEADGVPPTTPPGPPSMPCSLRPQMLPHVCGASLLRPHCGFARRPQKQRYLGTALVSFWQPGHRHTFSPLPKELLLLLLLLLLTLLSTMTPEVLTHFWMHLRWNTW